MSWRNHRSCLRRILKSGLDSHRFLLPPLQWKMVAFLKGLTPLHLSKKPFMSLVADNGTKRLDGYIIYGSVTEDILTGFKMHCRGWKSVYCMPKRPAFKGSAPINLSDWLHQVPRWALGSVEILLSRHCPLWYAYGGKIEVA